MKDRTLIKVVATIMEGNNIGRLKTRMARGIVPLKRGVSLFDYISAFLMERGITATLYQRTENSWATSPVMHLNIEPKIVITYHFLTFPVEDVGYYAKDLSKDELARDMKAIQKILKAKQKKEEACA